VYDHKRHKFVDESVPLPLSPVDGSPILFVPKRWLRFTPWLTFDEYFAEYCPRDQIGQDKVADRAAVLTFNRLNYGVVEGYVKAKELKREDCHNDPLFSQIPLTSAKASLRIIKNLRTGAEGQSDKKYEREMTRLLASLLYPHLDFAAVQSRTDSGIQIRDLIFYNNTSHPFLADIYRDYESRQLVFELKNVEQIDRENINQLHRYLAPGFGRFGVFITRYSLPRAMFKNTIDLWAGKRVCLIALTDSDIDTMVQLYETRQRDPIDVLKKSYVDFQRACPA
jgi:hypothetical protein